jgi:predicted O-methyltransferase YrrM
MKFWPISLNGFNYGMRGIYDWESPKTLYLELGSFCGASAITLASMTDERVSLVCIDTWDGRGMDEYKNIPRSGLELFQANLWEYRDRVTVIQDNTLDGMRSVAQMGLTPDVVFIDADHSQEAVRNDITVARLLWPEALICGDDFNEGPVSSAVLETVGRNIGVVGLQFWWEIKYDFLGEVKFPVPWVQ